ncbi:MAG: PQQ-binding-like beta-propeller repeat protein, partial [Thermoplasmata archaeon]|nr:PQQ-binding-like beta-propeller repeat protein [Thermoplasmata archaeon]
MRRKKCGKEGVKRLTVLFAVLLFVVPVGLVYGEAGGFKKGEQGRGDIREMDDWPTLMGSPAHTGYTDSLMPLNPSILWNTSIPGHTRSSPVVYQGRVYVGSGDRRLYCLDIDTGVILWSFNTYVNASVPGGEIRYAPSVSNGVVYFTTESYGVYAVNATDGTLLWYSSMPVRSVSRTPALTDDVLGIAGAKISEAYFYGVSMENGTILWSFSFPSLVVGITADPASDGERFYFGTDAGYFYCLDKDGFSDGNDGFTGENDTSPGAGDVIWVYNATRPIDGSPTIAGGVILFGDRAGYLHCLNRLTGTELWMRKVGDYLSSPPAVYNGKIYTLAMYHYYIAGFPYEGAKLTALRLSDGTELWNFTRTKPPVGSSPVTNGKYITFGLMDSKQYLINATDIPLTEENRMLWKIDLGMPITTSPAVIHGRIFVAINNTLYAIGVPEIYLFKVSTSDYLPYDGELAKLTAHLWNNGSVGTEATITFWRTTYRNSPKYLLGTASVFIPPRSFSTVNITAPVYSSTPYVWAIVEATHPRDPRLDKHPVGARLNLTVLPQIAWGWYTLNRNSQCNRYVPQVPTSTKIYWSVDLPGEPIGEPLVMKATVLLATRQGSVMAYTQYLESGKSTPTLLWKWTAPSNLAVAPVGLASSVYTSSDRDIIIVATAGGGIWALDLFGFADGGQPGGPNDGPYTAEPNPTPENPDIVWGGVLPGVDVVKLLPAFGKVYVLTSSGGIYAIDDDTGDVRWNTTIPGATDLLSAEGNIFVSTVDGELYTLRQYDGTVLDKINPIEVKIAHLSYFSGWVALLAERKITIIDANPDDNGDGVVDGNDTDEGMPDEPGSEIDVIFQHNLTSTPTGELSFSGDLLIIGEAGGVDVYDARAYRMLYFLNSTNMVGVIGLKESTCLIYGGGGVSLYTLPSPPSEPEQLWTTIGDFKAASFQDGYIFLYTSDGVIVLGAENRPPMLTVRSPREGDVFFTDEEIMVDLSGTIDPDGDEVEVEIRSATEGLLYRGNITGATITVHQEGRHLLVIRAYDPYGAYSVKSYNITALKKKISHFSSPAFNVEVTLCYGGVGYVEFEAKNVVGVEERALIRPVKMDFVPFFENEPYIIAWANITVDASNILPPFGLNLSRAAIYRLSNEEWFEVSGTGRDVEKRLFWANTTEFGGVYAAGIL